MKRFYIASVLDFAIPANNKEEAIQILSDHLCKMPFATERIKLQTSSLNVLNEEEIHEIP